MSFLNEEDGFDDPLDFKEIQFQKVDEHLRCPICKELLNATMMLKTCSHSFCALCIRRSLNTEQLCPKCRKPAVEKDLIHNYDLDNVVNTWRESRRLFLTIDRIYKSSTQQPVSMQQNMPMPNTQQHTQQHTQHMPQRSTSIQQHTSSKSSIIVIDNDETDDFVPPSHKKLPLTNGPARRSTRLQKQTPQNETPNSQESNSTISAKLNDLTVNQTQNDKLQVNQQQTERPQDNQTQSNQQQSQVNLPPQTSQSGYSPLQLNNRSQMSTPYPQLNQYQPNPPPPPQSHELKTTSMVECPICTQHMKYNVLDRHIDKCLQGDSRIPPDPPQPSSSSSNTVSYSTPTSSKMKVPAALRRPVDLGKKPVKMVYSMASDKDMRDCLRSLSLPEHGDKQLRVWRHKEYINLYNANADSQRPVSAHILRQQLQAMENAHLAEKSNQLKRKVTDFESHKSKYADQFADLIANAKRSKSSK